MSCVSRHPEIKPCMLGLLMCGVCGQDCTLQSVLAGGVRSHLSRRYNTINLVVSCITNNVGIGIKA